MRDEGVMRLRRGLEQQSRRRERRRYPVGLKDEAVRFCRAHVAGGGSIREAAEMLGLNAETLRQWGRRGERRDGFMRVEVIAEEPRPEPTPPAPPVVVHTPRGLRIEGLDLEALAVLIARIG